MSELFVECVGGPKDGETFWIPGHHTRIQYGFIKPTESEPLPTDKLETDHYEYRLRMVEGLAVRLPSGHFAMDYFSSGSQDR